MNLHPEYDVFLRYIQKSIALFFCKCFRFCLLNRPSKDDFVYLEVKILTKTCSSGTVVLDADLQFIVEENQTVVHTSILAQYSTHKRQRLIKNG